MKVFKFKDCGDSHRHDTTIPGTYIMPKADFRREHPDVYHRVLVCDWLEATRLVETNNGGHGRRRNPEVPERRRDELRF